MCTYIMEQALVSGSGKGARGWFPVNRASVGYDHPSHAPYEHALLLDFTNPELGTDARVAVEMNLDSAQALIEKLQAAVDAARESGVAE